MKGHSSSKILTKGIYKIIIVDIQAQIFSRQKIFFRNFDFNDGC